MSVHYSPGYDQLYIQIDYWEDIQMNTFYELTYVKKGTIVTHDLINPDDLIYLGAL